MLSIKVKLQTLRREIDNHLDHLEHPHVNEIENMQMILKPKYTINIQKLLSVVNDIKQIESVIDYLKSHGSDLQVFLDTHQLNQTIFQKIQSFQKDVKYFPNPSINFKILK